MRTVFDAWQDYARKIVPADAGAVQVEECRRAFYAGAISFYRLMMEASQDPNEAVCERNLERLHAELQEMPRDLYIGKTPVRGVGES